MKGLCISAVGWRCELCVCASVTVVLHAAEVFHTDTNSCSPMGERAVSPQQPLQPPVPKTETNGTCETDSAAEKDEDSFMESQYTVCRCPTATLVLRFTLIRVFLYWPHVTSNISQFISVDLGLQLTILSSLIELSVNPRTAGFFLALNGWLHA